MVEKVTIGEGNSNLSGVSATGGINIAIKNLLGVKKYNTLAAQDLEGLIPESIRHIVSDSPRISITTDFDMQKLEGKIVVVENEYPEVLTNPSSYYKWRKELEELRKTSKVGRILPGAPNDVNRLHSIFAESIDAGDLSLNDRVLLRCKFGLYLGNKEALYIHNYDGEEGLGIGKDFYLNTLPNFCKRVGLRFIVGTQHDGNIGFFRDKLGRYQLSDLKPKYKTSLFPGVWSEKGFTIQFLYSEDIEKYILPEKGSG